MEVQLPVLSIGTGLQDKGSEVTFNLSEDGQAFDGTNTFLELEGDLSSVRMEGEMRGFILLEELGQVPAFKGSFTNVRTSI